MAVATSTLLGRPVWYELMTTDMKSAEAFYRTVIGWETAPFEGTPQPYTTFNPPGGVSIAAQIDGERQRNGGADGMRVVITLQCLFEVAVIRLRRIMGRGLPMPRGRTRPTCATSAKRA